MGDEMMGPKNRKSTIGLGIAALVTSVTLAYSAYRFGMFFDVKFYRLEWMIIVAALMLAVIRAVYSRLERQKESSSIEWSEHRHQFKYIPNVPGPVPGFFGWHFYICSLSCMKRHRCKVQLSRRFAGLPTLLICG